MNNEKSRAKKVVLPIALSLAMVAGIVPMNASANAVGEPNEGGLVGTLATPTDTEESKLPERNDNITDEEYDRLLVGSVLDAFLEGNADAQAMYDELSDELKALVDASLEIEKGEDMNHNGAVGDSINDDNTLPNADALALTYKVEIKFNNAYQIFSENNPIKEIYINGNQADVTGNSFAYNFIYEWDTIEAVDSFDNRYNVDFDFLAGIGDATLTIRKLTLVSEHDNNMGYFYAYVTGDKPVSVEEALTNNDFTFLGRTEIVAPESKEATDEKDVIDQALASANYDDLNLKGKKFEAFRMSYGNAPQGPWDSTSVWHVDGLLVDENTYTVNFHFLDEKGVKTEKTVFNVEENSTLSEEFIPNVPQQVLSKKFIGWSLTEGGEKINPTDYMVTGNTDFYALYETIAEKEEAYYYVLKPGMAVPDGTSHSESEDWYFFGKGSINKVESYENTADPVIVEYATSDFNPADLEDGYNADRNKGRYQLKEDEEFIPIRLMWGNSPDAEDEAKCVWHVDGIVKKVGNYLVNYHYGLDLDQLKSFEFDVNTTSVIGSNVPDESLYNVPEYKFLGWSTEKDNKDKIVKDIANFEVAGNTDFYAIYEKIQVNPVAVYQVFEVEGSEYPFVNQVIFAGSMTQKLSEEDYLKLVEENNFAPIYGLKNIAGIPVTEVSGYKHISEKDYVEVKNEDGITNVFLYFTAGGSGENPGPEVAYNYLKVVHNYEGAPELNYEVEYPGISEDAVSGPNYIDNYKDEKENYVINKNACFMAIQQNPDGTKNYELTIKYVMKKYDVVIYQDWYQQNTISYTNRAYVQNDLRADDEILLGVLEAKDGNWDYVYSLKTDLGTSVIEWSGVVHDSTLDRIIVDEEKGTVEVHIGFVNELVQNRTSLHVNHVYPNGSALDVYPEITSEEKAKLDAGEFDSYAVPKGYVVSSYALDKGVADEYGNSIYTLTIVYEEKAPEQKNINVQVRIDNDAAGTITSGTDFTLTVNEGEKANVTVTWDLNYRYRTDSITINGVEIDLSSSDRSYTFDVLDYLLAYYTTYLNAGDDTVTVVVNTYRNTTPVDPTDPDTDPEEEIEDDPTPEVGGDEEIEDDPTPEVGGEEEIEDEATPEAGNKDNVTDTGVASTMPWMVASLVSLGAMVAELIRRKRH